MAATGDIIGGFVEDNIDQFPGRPNHLAFNINLIPGRINPGAEFGDGPAIDGDFTGNYKFFPFAARADTGRGQKFLESHFTHRQSACRLTSGNLN
jgi:hypothetical protein